MSIYCHMPCSKIDSNSPHNHRFVTNLCFNFPNPMPSVPISFHHLSHPPPPRLSSNPFDFGFVATFLNRVLSRFFRDMHRASVQVILPPPLMDRKSMFCSGSGVYTTTSHGFVFDDFVAYEFSH
ncbi:hypothetical protein D8674_039954 [Pyrus ussuriensis x Pyrus communis]|uniref:Uncharacterized protein n=1 Tax=Pyrus ussuriensis x Pyrus communis TaxID=2448454 RepID=A0A5N5FSR2_9ROSA|nr:hypothetical protein D8674_039954 [Pyrus ussuriensis x Pyrus communis]